MSKEFINGGSLEWNGREYGILATKETVKAMKKAAIYTQSVAKEMVGGPGSGRLYRRRRQKGKRGTFTRNEWHRASLPGNPPARDTGILANSISYRVETRGFKVRGFVGSDRTKIARKAPRTDVDYGYFLEVGTRNMRPRPWLRPSLLKAKPKILQIFKRAFK